MDSSASLLSFCRDMPMIVYFLRHASSGVRREDPVLDRKRGLDKEGKRQCLVIGAYLGALRVNFDAIISSPLKRALQTASLVATEVGFEQKIITDSSLEPSGRFADFIAMLGRNSERETVLVVGHNPNLAQFASGLIVTGPRGDRAAVRLRKAGLARIDLNRRPGQLLDLVEARSLQQFQTSATKRSRRKTSRK